jgi:hypothetical protein
MGMSFNGRMRLNAAVMVVRVHFSPHQVYERTNNMELIFYLLLLFSVLVPMIVSRKEEDVSAPPFFVEPDDGRRHKFPPEDSE